jgi:hypothetical protein
MADLSKATPRPWKACERYAPTTDILDQGGFAIVEVQEIAILDDYAKKLRIPHWGRSERAHRDLSVEEVEANTALIMEAVNNYDRLKRVEKVGLRLADYIDTLGAVAGVPDLRTWKLVLAKARELLAEIARAA